MIRCMMFALLTYIRRPLNWLTMLPAVGFLIFMVVLPLILDSVVTEILDSENSAEVYRSNVGPELNRHRSYNSTRTENWETFLASRDTTKIKALRLSRDYLVDEDPVPDLSVLPQLRTLQLNRRQISTADIDRLVAATQLDSLEIEADEIPNGTFARLGPQLRELEIAGRLLLAHSDEVSALTELRLLRIDPRSVGPEMIGLIAQIPRLRYLVISDQIYDFGGSQEAAKLPPPRFRPHEFETLAKHPSLRGIFAEWEEDVSPRAAAANGLWIFPGSQSGNHFISLVVLGFVMVFSASTIYTQLWSLFVIPAAGVIPGYAAVHRRVAACLIGGACLMVWVGLFFSDVARMPAAALTLSFFAIAPGMVLMPQSPRPWIRQIAPVYLMFVIGVGWLWISGWSLPSLISMPTVTGNFVWFLDGKLPLLAAGLLLLELVLLAVALAKWPELTRNVQERSPVAPGLSVWDPQQAKRNQYGWKNWKFSQAEQPVKRPSLDSPLFWEAVERWRRGNGNQTRRMGVIAMVLLAMLAPIAIIFDHTTTMAQSLFVVCLFQGVLVTIALSTQFWLRRRKTLAIESLRPIERRDFVTQLFSALAMDQLWGVIPLAMTAGYLLYMVPEIWTPWNLGGLALSLAAIMAWAFAGSTAIFAFKRDWVVTMSLLVLLGIPGISLSPTIIVWNLSSGPSEAPGPTLPEIGVIAMMVSAVVLLAAGVVIYLMHRRAVWREWG